MYDVDDFIDMLEGLGEADWTNAPNFKVFRAVRDELTSLGMGWQNRDLFVARMTVNIDAELTEEQMDRLLKVVRKLVRKFYTTLEKEGYDSQVIAEFAKSLKINMSF